MPKQIPEHVQGLLEYLSRPHEKANEDRALTYFRKAFGESFTRQQDARRADGYLPGSFVLELKGRTNDWLSGLLQGLAYRNVGLDFSQVVVAAENFLAVWRVEDLPEHIREAVLEATGAPNRIGISFAKQYAKRRKELFNLAVWSATELAEELFQQPSLILERVSSFQRTIEKGRKQRLQITVKNFTSVLQEMRSFFDPKMPVKTVRGFYSMLYGWTENSTIRLSNKVSHEATLEGETITDLLPSARSKFKDYVENHYVHLGPNDNHDDFFARYDQALDAVDSDFRIKHGIYFTDRDLSKFVMWVVKQYIPNLGKNYLVIDPACGSGNLVTNWRSPLELRHKVVSEIEPELLFAVERRMQGDQWHHGKFTVVPKVSENKGLNFLDRSADDYISEMRTYLAEKGHKPDKPLAFLCNPPYRSDDDQTAERVEYQVHESIKDLVGNDASSERYCCFLAQMKLICDAAKSNGLPDDSLLLLFTKSAWLTRRPVFSRLREQMLGSFEDVAGILVNGKEFFNIKGKWPVAFSLWRYRGKGKALDPKRDIEFTDLTWLKNRHLREIPWDNPGEMTAACGSILRNPGSINVGIGRERKNIKVWSGVTRKDFMRGRRKSERNLRVVGGLPLGDNRQRNKKAYGESNGGFIGFMDELTPCRVRKSTPDKPWLYLDARFMSIKKARCLSGPPTHLGYCAANLDAAKKLFFWYALAKTFLQHSYPMWVDADEMWEPAIPPPLERKVYQTAFAIAYAENECVQTTFPANNPIDGVPEIVVNNPMTPLDPGSFWSEVMHSYCMNNPSSQVSELLGAVDALFKHWKRLFKNCSQLPIPQRPYHVDMRSLEIGAGIVQIRDYAQSSSNEVLLADLTRMQALLRLAKTQFFELATSKSGFNYFGAPKKKAATSSSSTVSKGVA